MYYCPRFLRLRKDLYLSNSYFHKESGYSLLNWPDGFTRNRIFSAGSHCFHKDKDRLNSIQRARPLTQQLLPCQRCYSMWCCYRKCLYVAVHETSKESYLLCLLWIHDYPHVKQIFVEHKRFTYKSTIIKWHSSWYSSLLCVYSVICFY